MKKQIEVIACGQMVKIGDRGNRCIDAEIVGICIRPDYIKYDVSWWEGRKKQTMWMGREEFTISGKPKKIKVGFETETNKHG